MELDDIFTKKDEHIIIDELRDNLQNPSIDEYDEIFAHPLMSKLESFNEWKQECIDAGFIHLFEMTIGSARETLYKDAIRAKIFHYYIQRFLDIVDLLQSPHSSVFVSANYGGFAKNYIKNDERVRLNLNKYEDIVPYTQSMHICICIRFGKHISDWFRMMRRLWNSYINEYNNIYGIGIWEQRVYIFPGGNIIPKSARRFYPCETQSMSNFGGNMTHIGVMINKKHKLAFSPSLCECITKGCQKYRIFDLTNKEVAEKIKRYMLRYGEDTGVDPYNNERNHCYMYY